MMAKMQSPSTPLALRAELRDVDHEERCFMTILYFYHDHGYTNDDGTAFMC
jgi:hypothetical protein